ncbi:MAG TPA: ABC transporter ATP-binding protein [Rhodanobacteraceae bacterium]|nr:ABC transporter ATP-binding protein [Rhodanobacteraceae bacterium]
MLQGVSFTLERGDTLALLGVNGAGKSTTLSIIAGVLAADGGQVRIDGRDIANGVSARRRVGWVPETVPLWPELTVTEALDACGRLHGLSAPARRVASTRELARLDLGAVARRRCGQLSLGQKRRVGLAQALLSAPDLLVLDEPGNGLDPLQAAQLRALIKALRPDHGIVVSSHLLGEVAAMCTRMVILNAGRVEHDGPLDAKPGALDAWFRAGTNGLAAA